MSDFQRYDSRTQWLHWLSAGGIALMWVLGQIVDFFPQPQRYLVISTHIVIGLALIAVIAMRLSWRLGGGGRKLPKAEEGLLGTAAVGVHHLLYLLIVVTLALGLVLEATRGDYVYHLVQIPNLLPVERALRRAINGYHELAANALLILAAGHAAAALWHHFVKKDGVLLRMK